MRRKRYLRNRHGPGEGTLRVDLLISPACLKIWKGRTVCRWIQTDRIATVVVVGSDGDGAVDGRSWNADKDNCR